MLRSRMLMAAIYAGWMRAQQASRHFVALVIFEILRTFHDATLRASFGYLRLALVLLAVPDLRGRNFFSFSHKALAW